MTENTKISSLNLKTFMPKSALQRRRGPFLFSLPEGSFVLHFLLVLFLLIVVVVQAEGRTVWPVYGNAGSGKEETARIRGLSDPEPPAHLPTRYSSHGSPFLIWFVGKIKMTCGCNMCCVSKLERWQTWKKKTWDSRMNSENYERHWSE